MVERYREGKVYCVVKFCCTNRYPDGVTDFDLVIFRVPAVSEENLRSTDGVFDAEVGNYLFDVP